MTYARSYATSHKPKKQLLSAAPPIKEKFAKLHFRPNSFRTNTRFWPKIKNFFLGACFTLCLASLLAGLVSSWSSAINTFSPCRISA